MKAIHGILFTAVCSVVVLSGCRPLQREEVIGVYRGTCTSGAQSRNCSLSLAPGKPWWDPKDQKYNEVTYLEGTLEVEGVASAPVNAQIQGRSFFVTSETLSVSQGTHLRFKMSGKTITSSFRINQDQEPWNAKMTKTDEAPPQ